MRIVILPCLFALLSPPALAQTDALPPSDAERQEKLQRASSLKAEAAKLRKEADARQADENQVCYKKILVSSCVDDARKEHTKTVREAKRLELQADEIERDLKRRDVAARDAKRAAEAPIRAADQQEKGEKYRAEEASKADARAAKAADKERQAAAGREKTTKEQARRERAAEDRVKKDAKVAEKRRKREEEAARKAAKYPEGPQPGSPRVVP